jgi:STE24 endopeptidase
LLHVCIIVVFASLILRGQLAGPLLGGEDGGLLGVGWTLSNGTLLWLIPVLHLFIAAVVDVAARRALKQVERNSSLRPVETLDLVVMAARVTAALLTAVSVCLLGFLDAVRSVTWGDTVFIDEALTVLPFLLVVVAGWWSSYPIEKLLRESVLVRDLDEGRPIYPVPARASYVWGQVRHQLFILLLPMAVLVIWGDTIDLVAQTATDRFHAASRPGGAPAGGGWLGGLGAWISGHREAASLAYYILKLSGLALIVAAAPLAIRRVWDTVPLRDGSVAEGLLRMCRLQRVKVRELLVWRTGGTMINGAVLGILGSARFILLTDALLDVLPNHCVQAVMAHEIGHVRCRHVPWLTATLFAASGTALVAMNAALNLLLGLDIDHLPGAWQLALSALALGFAILAFGYVSRRFEWQADAFAVKHFSEHTPPTDDATAPWAPSPTATRPAVKAMCAALDIVATANHLPKKRFTFRHGSIATRIARLESLEGVPVDRLPIDAVSRRVKWAIGLGCIVVLATAVLSMASP